RLDDLAATGVRFHDAFCDTTWTTPSMASTLTGRYAIHHGLETPYRQLSERETTLAEVLAAQGYQTAAILGSFEVDHIFNLSQGFQRYDDRYNASILELPVQRPHLRSVFHGDVDADRSVRVQKLEADSYRTDDS